MATLLESFKEGCAFDPEATRVQKLAGGLLLLIEELQTRPAAQQAQKELNEYVA